MHQFVVPRLTTSPVNEPFVPPAPICNVPAKIVVPPEKATSLANVS